MMTCDLFMVADLLVCVSCTFTDVSSDADGWNGDTCESVGLRHRSNIGASSAESTYVPEYSMCSHQCYEISAKLLQERPGIYR